MEFPVEQIVIVLLALLAVSEALALIPAVKANGIFQLAMNSLKALVGLFKKPEAEAPKE